jgi:hypothetical protein
MQSRLLTILTIILFSFLLIHPPVLVAEEELHLIRQLSNEIYRLSQEMITHGSEGHAHEIVSYGQEMVRRTEALIGEVGSNPSPKLKEKKKPILASLKETLNQAKKAVRLGEEEKTGPAIDAARKASFQAKQLRQQIQSLK